jgi:2-pyrone-4,6-dicarboxylate lactonase
MPGIPELSPSEMNGGPGLTYHAAPRKPALRLPAGACDTHCHIFGPQNRFPFPPDAMFRPADAPKEKLFALHAMLGFTRSVIVQSACHGFDNSVVADALADKAGACRGVALLPLTVSDTELARLDSQGFRGVRFNFMKHLGKSASIEEVIGFTPRLAAAGWHLQIHLDPRLLEGMIPALKRSAVRVVIDHMARIDASLGLDQPAFQALLDLMKDDRFWVKVSGCERASREGPPYSDAIPFAQTLAGHFGDRVLWGTDWPHPNFSGPIPDDGQLADLIAQIAPSQTARQALLVDNPARLYGFNTAVQS